MTKYFSNCNLCSLAQFPFKIDQHELKTFSDVKCFVIPSFGKNFPNGIFLFPFSLQDYESSDTLFIVKQ